MKGIQYKDTFAVQGSELFKLLSEGKMDAAEKSYQDTAMREKGADDAHPRDTLSASRDPVCDVSSDHYATVQAWTWYHQVPGPDRPRLVIDLNTTKPR